MFAARCEARREDLPGFLFLPAGETAAKLSALSVSDHVASNSRPGNGGFLRGS